jgi:hypothetical protein
MILPLYVDDWPEEWCVEFVERVAIMHYGSGKAIAAAEKMAEKEVRRMVSEW